MLSDLPALVVLAVPVLVVRPWLAKVACPPPLSPAAHVPVRDGVAGGGQAWLARAASKHVDGKSSRKCLPLVPLPPQGSAPPARLLFDTLEKSEQTQARLNTAGLNSTPFRNSN